MKTHPGHSRSTFVRQLAAAMVLCAWTSSTPLLAGQTGSAFEISVTLLPAGAGSGCTTTVDARGRASVSCQPPVIIGGAGAAAAVVTGSSVVTGRYPADARVLVAADAVTEEAESFFSWGECSSRIILAGGREYVETTVMW